MIGPFRFIHIPKTGGTTLVKILKKQYNVLHSDSEYEIKNYENYDIVFGHSSYKIYNDLPSVTWVRHPVERVISHYFFYKSTIATTTITYPGIRESLSYDIIDFAKQTPNIMSSYIGNDLSIFKYIGVTELYDKSYRGFSETFELNLPNTYEKHRVGNSNKRIVDNTIRQKIEDLNIIDMELYNVIIRDR